MNYEQLMALLESDEPIDREARDTLITLIEQSEPTGEEE